MDKLLVPQRTKLIEFRFGNGCGRCQCLTFPNCESRLNRATEFLAGQTKQIVPANASAYGGRDDGARGGELQNVGVRTLVFSFINLLEQNQKTIY